MRETPVEIAASLRIGEIEFVSPDEIKVILDHEAPSSIALNTGDPTPFPRVNGYLMVAVDDVLIVGQIEWITVERAPLFKHRVGQESRLLDFPYPVRRLRLNPLGTLRSRDYGQSFSFQRGVDLLPTVGTAVLLPTDAQLHLISEFGENRRIKIGTNPLAGDAPVYVDPNPMFGLHLAVIGNTGSGKSSTVAGLIRWSLEQAMLDRNSDKLNARFIILDPNGEYSRAFASDKKINARIFKVDPSDGEYALQVPLWFWNSAEWCSFTQASTRTQRPMIKRALRDIKSGRIDSTISSEEEKNIALRLYLSGNFHSINRDLNSGAIRTDESKFGFRLKAIADDLKPKIIEHPNNRLSEVLSAVDDSLNARYNEFETNGKTVKYYRAFTENEVKKIVAALQSALSTLGGITYQEGLDEDVPRYFQGTAFADHLEHLSIQANVGQYSEFFISRVRTLLSDPRMKAIVDVSDELSLRHWLTNYIGSDTETNESVSIVDLSLVPTEILHIVTAVIARMTFEALQRYMKLHGKALPTVLVMEEAHTFIKRYKEDVENQDAAAVCCQVFERIAREGRKFGLGLVLSSQRPSELSPSVLSQCNTYVLHRISNDLDQQLVHRLVPDNLKGLLRELPVLPSQTAIMLGWATELPVLLKINDLPKSQLPRSDDPDYWGTWTSVQNGDQPLKSDKNWKDVAEDWSSV